MTLLSELTQLSADGLCRKHEFKQDCRAAAHKLLGASMFCGEAAFLHASDVTPSRIAAMFPLMLPKVLDSVVEGLDAAQKKQWALAGLNDLEAAWKADFDYGAFQVVLQQNLSVSPACKSMLPADLELGADPAQAQIASSAESQECAQLFHGLKNWYFTILQPGKAPDYTGKVPKLPKTESQLQMGSKLYPRRWCGDALLHYQEAWCGHVQQFDVCS